VLNRVDQPFWKAAAQAAQAWLQRPLPGPGVPGVPLPRGRLARQALFAGDYTSSGFYGYVGGGSTVGRCWPAAWPAGLILSNRADQALPAQALSSFGSAAEGHRLLCDR
jgi:hypothetical protein